MENYIRCARNSLSFGSVDALISALLNDDLIDMAQKTTNIEWCSLKTPVTRLAHGNHADRGFVETDALEVGGRDVRHSNFTGAEYEIKPLGIGQDEDKKPTASIEVTRTGRDVEKETRNAELVDWSAPQTDEAVLEDQKGGMAAAGRTR